MLSLSGSMRIFVYSLPTDMRRQLDGLSALVTHTLERDVFTGDYFVFFNRSRTLCKILSWDPKGFQMFVQRLERGTFQRPAFDGNSMSTQVDALTLSMILGGIELESVKRRKRYVRPLETVSATTTSSPSPAGRVDATLQC
jgi:transposase